MSKGNITFNQAIAISIGSIIGWGAYVLPGNLFLTKGGFYSSVAGLAVGSFCVYVIAMAYIFLLKRTPENQSGGVFWVQKYLNSRHAFVYGWGVALAYLSIISLNLSAVVLLLRFLLPDGVQAFVYLYSIAGWDVYLSDILSCVLILGVFGIANYRGIEIGAKIQLLISTVMIASVLLIFAGSVTDAVGSDQPLFPDLAEVDTVWTWAWVPILAVMPWAYVGFETTPQLSRDIANSRTRTQYIITISMFFGFVFYLLVDYVTALNMQFDYGAVMASDWATGEGIEQAMGNFGMVVLAVAMLMSILSGINGFMLATYKLLESMIREDLLAFGDSVGRQARHKRIILLICAVCITTPWLGRNYLLEIVNMASLWISFGYLYVVWIAFSEQRKEGKVSLMMLLALVIAVLFLLLLLLPFSPAALSGDAYIMLVVFIALGAVFFYRKFISKNAKHFVDDE
ncbi:APC family permease [Cardiobacteriaceae bacterium TAE3-ERU3]|nr:APC family permease [Cardiobacteriaceae bacterium TAE3-ERU3]